MFALRRFVAPVLLLSGFGCSDFGPGPSTSIQFHFTEADRREALYLALDITGELLPSESTINAMLISINTIRHIYSDSIRIDPMIRERLAARFEPRWAPGETILAFDSLTFRQVQAGTYSGWNRLPFYLRIRPPTQYSSSGWCVISFPEQYHPGRVADICKAILPGVRSAFPNMRLLSGSCKWPVAVWVAADELSYVFSRLSSHDFEERSELYFRYLGGEPTFIAVVSHSPD
jgi:hypothetical protein